LYWSNSYLTFYKTYLSSNSTYIESYFNPGAEFSVTKLKQEINDNYLLLTPRTNFIYSSQLHTSLGYLYKKEYLDQVVLPQDKELDQDYFESFLTKLIQEFDLSIGQMVDNLDKILQGYYQFTGINTYFSCKKTEINAQGHEFIKNLDIDFLYLPDILLLPESFINEEYLKECYLTQDKLKINFKEQLTKFKLFQYLGSKSLIKACRNLYPAISSLHLQLTNNLSDLRVIGIVPKFGRRVNVVDYITYTPFERAEYNRDLVDQLEGGFSDQLIKERDGLLIAEPKSFEDVEYNLKIFNEYDIPENRYKKAFEKELKANSFSLNLYSQFPLVVGDILAKLVIRYYLQDSATNIFLHNTFRAIDNRTRSKKLDVTPLEQMPISDNSNLVGLFPEHELESLNKSTQELLSVPENNLQLEHEQLLEQEQLELFSDQVKAELLQYKAKNQFSKKKNYKHQDIATKLEEIDFNLTADDSKLLYRNPNSIEQKIYQQTGIDWQKIKAISPYKVNKKIGNVEKLIQKELSQANFSYAQSFLGSEAKDFIFYHLTPIEDLSVENHLVLSPLAMRTYIESIKDYMNKNIYRFLRNTQTIDFGDQDEQPKFYQYSYLNLNKPIKYLLPWQNPHLSQDVPNISIQNLDLYLNARRYAKIENPTGPLPAVIYIEDVLTFFLQSLQNHYDFKALREYYNYLIKENVYSNKQSELIKLSVVEYSTKIDELNQGIREIYNRLANLAKEFNLHIIMNFN
ncbi:hypothetical protein, partial [Psittacicella gerlachiana]